MIINQDRQQIDLQGRGFGASTPRPPVRKISWLPKVIIALLLVAVTFGGVTTASLAYQAGYQLYVQVGSQPSALVDLRQSIPISPYLLGANVFPEAGTDSLDQADSGFMSYAAPIVNGLQSAHIKLLRFPGGNWGEQHAYSFEQMNDFSTLLTQTDASGMIQVPLSDVSGQASTLATRASYAGLIVDYMNNKDSIQRTGKFAQAPYHPVTLWTVGNEPDLLLNQATGLPYTADQYAQAFIQYSIAMHQNDPHIQVFGPEISQFYGVGAGPSDATGKLWMEEFLKDVSNYERQHPELPFHLLDGVSFHSYPFGNAQQAATKLLSSANVWDRILPSLHQLIRQDFERDMPVAITEVNTNPNKDVPAQNLAALWWADTLGRLMSQQVAYVAFFSAEGVDTPYPLFTSKGLQETSMLRVMQLFAQLQHNLVPIPAQGEPVSIYTTQDDTHQTVSLLFVNKSDSPQQVQVSSGAGVLPVSPWQAQHISLGAYGIAVVTLHRDGGADAYGYATPTGTATTPTLVHVVCGNANSGSTNTISC